MAGSVVAEIAAETMGESSGCVVENVHNEKKHQPSPQQRVAPQERLRAHAWAYRKSTKMLTRWRSAERRDSSTDGNCKQLLNSKKHTYVMGGCTGCTATTVGAGTKASGRLAPKLKT
jgi:hypothetical protein